MWSVISTVRAPRHHLDKFVNFYLGAGAERIFLFFDDPALAWPVSSPHVKVVVCDGSYWGDSRPETIEERQRLNARRALRWCASEWLLHCDVDELVLGPAPIADLLAGVPTNVASVLVPPYEAVYDREPGQHNAYDTRFFKRLMKHEGKGWHPAVWEVYGSLTRMTTGGFWGHIRGKSFARKRLCPSYFPIHKYDEGINGAVVNHVVESLKLLHFDTLTFVDWKEKALRRLDGAVLARDMGDKRRQQIDAIRNARENWGEWGLHDLYRKMAVIEPDVMKRAIDAGFVHEVDR